MQRVDIRIFASHPLVTERYETLLSGDASFAIHPAGNSYQVAIVDSGHDCVYVMLDAIRADNPAALSMIVSPPCDADECYGWLLRGTWGLVTYDKCESELPPAIRHVAEHRLWFPGDVVRRWMQRGAEEIASEPHTALTAREKEVFDLVRHHLTNKEVAAVLRISERTVKFHLSNIFHKLNVSSRVDLQVSVV